MAVVAVLIHGTAYAGLIFSRNFNGRGGLNLNASSVSIRFSLYEGTDQSTALEMPVLETASTATPQTLSIDSTGGQLFLDAVRLISNGINDSNNLFITLRDAGGRQGRLGFGIGSDALTFYGDRTGLSGVDLAGRTIERISLELEAVYLHSPGTNPNGDGSWTDVALFSKLKIYGSGDPLPLLDDPNRPTNDPFSSGTGGGVVPEPSTFVLGVVGTLIMLSYAGSRHRKP